MVLSLDIAAYFKHGSFREHAGSFAVYLIIALIIFWNIAANISGSVFNNAGASYQGMWNLWWSPYSMFVLHQNPYFSNFILYPVGTNLEAQALAPVAGVLTWPLQQISLAFAYNVLLFLSFALGGLFMYMLAKYIIKNSYAAFISGLIFAFSPVHIALSYSGLQWTSIEFMPLFVLLFLIAIDRKRMGHAFAAGVVFFLIAFFGDLQQAAMTLFFAGLSFFLLAAIDKRIDRAVIKPVGVIVIVALLACLPMIALMASAQGQGSSASAQVQLNNIPHQMLYSDTLASFFLPSFYNGILGGLAKNYYNETYGLNYTGVQTTSSAGQKVAYFGYTVAALSAIGIAFMYGKERRQVLYWSSILVIFALLAMGPVLQITGTRQGTPAGPVSIGTNATGGNVTGIPLLYFVYRYIPVINTASRPGAFDLFAEMALAILAGFGFEKISKLGVFHDKVFMAVVILSALILIEYNGMQFSGTSAAQLTANARIPPAFYDIGNFSANFSVLSLPALPAENGSFAYPGMAMLYATAAKKQLVGGYSAVINTTQQLALEDIPLVVQTNYLTGNQGFIYPYPINENYSNLTLLWLANPDYRVGFVSIINKAFDNQSYTSLVNYLSGVLGGYVYQDSNVTIFQTSGAINAKSESNLLGYIVGTWVPGYLFCSAVSCNSEFATMWWGGNVRAINIFSPKNGAITIHLDALSYYSSAEVAVFNSTAQIATMNITNYTASRQTFAFTTKASQGFNQVLFYEQNSTLAQENPNYAKYPYFNYGLYNISLSYANVT